MRVIIAGCGIGGSVLALALEQLGRRDNLEYLVLEQSPKLFEVGAGIQLSPNGVCILEWLGLGGDLAKFGVEPGSHQLKNWQNGETVLQTPLKAVVRDKFGSPYYHAHRADLIDAIAVRLNPNRVHLNSKVVSAQQNNDKVTVRLEDGTSETGDVLIGADGIHSVIRNQVFNPEPPRPSGYVAWRGMVSASRAAHLAIDKQSVAVMGPGLSIVFYYVSGGAKINWVAIGTSKSKINESWSQTASKIEVQKRFKGWYEHARGLVDLTNELFATALYDREPLRSWTNKRIAVMGDAAHAMLPYHAQGAVQSIEDAWVLARCLQMGQDEPEAALSKYEYLRKDRTQRLQMHSRNAEYWYHLDDAEEVDRRNARLAAHANNSETGLTPQQIWLFGYNAEKAALGTDDDWRALREW